MFKSQNLSFRAIEGRIDILDKKSCQLLMIFLQQCYKPIEIKVGGMFKIPLNMSTFINVSNFNLFRKKSLFNIISNKNFRVTSESRGCPTDM